MKVNIVKTGIFILLAFISIVTSGWQCGSMGDNQYTYFPYSWITGSSTGVVNTAYSATLSSTINPGGVETSAFFEWGSVYGWSATTARSVGNGNFDVTFTETINNLLPNTTYSYRLVLIRNGELIYNDNQTFTTAGRPSAVTEIATNVSSLSATLNAAVNPNGLDTTVYFQWGRSSSYGNTTAEQSVGEGTVNVYVPANISGLSPYSTYFFRVVARNTEGTVYGENRTFTSGPPYPIATTYAASSINYNSAIVNGLVNPNNQDTTVYFQWGPTAAYGNVTSSQTIPAGISNVGVQANLTGLAASATYYFVLVARNPAGTSYGAQQSFSTLAPPPAVTTNPVATITYNTAILPGVVNPYGLATTAYFQYGTSVAYGSQTAIQSLGSSITNVAVAASVSGLIGNTQYYYRLVATNASGTTYGSNQSFATPVAPPIATTSAAGSIGQTSALLNASVNPNGGATSVYFEYGTVITYSNSTSPVLIGSGTSPVIISQNITGLSPSTTYFFRIVAINGTGTTNGNSLQFTTSAQPPAVTTLAPSSGVSTTTATLNGTVNPNGAATTAYFQWGYSTSFGYQTSNQTLGNGRITLPINSSWSWASGTTVGTIYYYRLVASNSGGTSLGATYAFTIPAANAPNVTIAPATNIGRTNAQLNGIVNSNGQSTTVTFQYGQTSYYYPYYWYTQSPYVNNGTGFADNNVSPSNTQLSPVLTPNTTYYYRIIATNASGTTTSGILSFRTLP